MATKSEQRNAKQGFFQYIKKTRDKHIPKDFNQIKLAEYLIDDDIDHLLSISNRTDGKTFNYIHLAIKLSLDYDVKFTLITRNYMSRMALLEVIYKVCEVFEDLDHTKVNVRRTQEYIVVLYNGETIGLITDLNSAPEFKNHAAFVRDFPFMIYEEFLALVSEYLPDEWEKLKMIFETIDRIKKEDRPMQFSPKILYLGNAVNFSSPILANLDLFNKLEKHTINTVRKYGNIVLEMNRNDSANKKRNTRAFFTKDDAMTSGQFTINYHNIIKENELLKMEGKQDFIVCKLQNGSFLRITISDNTKIPLLEVTINEDSYQYNLLLSDNNSKSTFLDPDKWFKDYFYKKHNKNLFRYKNSYSKDYITNGNLVNLNIFKIIKVYNIKKTQNTTPQMINEKVMRDNYERDTIRKLQEKFFR